MRSSYFNMEYEGRRDLFPEIRGLMTEAYSQLDDYELEEWLEEAFPGVTADAFESFVGAVRDFGQAAAPFLQKGLAGAAKGAVVGAPLGPYGVAAGAAGGALLSATGTRLPGTPSTTPTGQPVTATPTAPVPTGATTPLSSAAGVDLLSKLFDPRTLEALLLVGMGTAGKPTVPVGDKRVNADAFLKLLETLVAKAATEHQMQKGITGEAVPEYLLSETGEFICDVASPIERAEALERLMESEVWTEEPIEYDSDLEETAEDEIFDEEHFLSIEEEAESYW